MVLILQEIDGAKEIGMTTVRFISDPDCNEADFKVGSFDDLLNLSFQKFDPVSHKKTNGRQWDPYARCYAIRKSHGSSLEDCFSYK